MLEAANIRRKQKSPADTQLALEIQHLKQVAPCSPSDAISYCALLINAWLQMKALQGMLGCRDSSSTGQGHLPTGELPTFVSMQRRLGAIAAKVAGRLPPPLPLPASPSAPVPLEDLSATHPAAPGAGQRQVQQKGILPAPSVASTSSSSSSGTSTSSGGKPPSHPGMPSLAHAAMPVTQVLSALPLPGSAHSLTAAVLRAHMAVTGGRAARGRAAACARDCRPRSRAAASR